MLDLAPITKSCTPRADVLGGGLADNHFAAQLDQVVRNPTGYPVYGDPNAFFAITYPTSGLRQLLTWTFGRISGAHIPGAEHGVIRLATSFGGGKTHGLMAVYHLARGARPPDLADFVDPALVPAKCRVAAVVADTLDPENGLVTNGIRTHTLWGELAAQLGPDAYAQLKASDEGRTAPGKTTWESIVGDEPTIFIIDEIAHHLRQLTSSGNPEIRRQAKAIPPFLKSLFELAAGNPKVVVIITLATRADAYGHETEELAQLLDEAQAEFQEALKDAQSVVSRTGTVIKPAEDAEIVQILKRRLFASIDSMAASEAASRYRTYYEELSVAGEQLGGGAEAPTTYSELIKASYPFHPELVRVLDKRIGSIGVFNRARGALKLLAEVVNGIWQEDGDVDLLNVADIDFSRPGDPLAPDDRDRAPRLRAGRAGRLRRGRLPRRAGRCDPIRWSGALRNAGLHHRLLPQPRAAHDSRCHPERLPPRHASGWRRRDGDRRGARRGREGRLAPRLGRLPLALPHRAERERDRRRGDAQRPELARDLASWRSSSARPSRLMAR